MGAEPPAGLTYSEVGMSRPGAEVPPGFRVRERRIRLGEGDALWKRAVAVVSGWRIKTAIGFEVVPDDERVVAGRYYDTTYRSRLVRQFEPVRVVWVAEEPRMRGFGYGTRPAHPLTGEECFLVERDADGAVWLITRTVTRVSRGPWRWLAPAVRAGVRIFQRRYAESAVRLILGTDAPLPGLRRARRRMVGEGPSGVDGIARLGYGLGPAPGPFDRPPEEPVELDADELPWELRGGESDSSSNR
ncbi:DUF1990 domain-containing protein [Protaetiibacter sp. SSC-01]|uniref:DUF1990 family protein n=1 Tax=Protaetiibacter sp. SSC-01 TaxID=2759943 RepID=UPI001656F7A0|nr:DUF1990 domain-containing protein [Protaetiibacter sp. SSC-01]QNO36662.1 DUF1990 domain-containing protein [Protaetiibacter sp. SSC-01]